ncbi:MAG: hypothetical protein JXA89_22250 [Anaerolineae bacterium]|nr:hypothetical protein [Anaerolineae bacterium]
MRRIIICLAASLLIWVSISACSQEVPTGLDESAISTQVNTVTAIPQTQTVAEELAATIFTPTPQLTVTLAQPIPSKREATVPPGRFDLSLAELVAQARNDLANRLGLQTEQIDLEKVESVFWSDESLGCPQPGIVYTQVQVEGTLIKLRAAGQIYEYHSGGGKTPFFCEQAKKGWEVMKTVPVTPTNTIQDPKRPTVTVAPGLEPLVAQAKKDLAERLSISVARIVVLEAESVVWPDGGLGCPRPGMAYSQVQVEGTRIRLGVGKVTYDYHSGRGRAPFLCESPDGSLAPPPRSNE